MKKLLTLFLFIFCCAPLTFAQSTYDYNRFEFYAGYSHNRVDTTIDNDLNLSDDRTGFNGLNASITGNISRYIGLKFDYAFHHSTIDLDGTVSDNDPGVNINTFLGGVQIKDNSNGKRLKPFGHVLAGVARTSIDASEPRIFPTFIGDAGNNSVTGFSAALGGGLDVGLTPRIDIRAFQFDYNPLRIGDTTLHNYRFGVGIVFH